MSWAQWWALATDWGDLAGPFNLAEGLLWWAIALGLGLARVRGRASVAPAWAWWALVGAFVAFGASDWVEIATGAWWRPWPLLALKAACVGAIAALGWRVWPRSGA